jgi:hypothetical protein
MLGALVGAATGTIIGWRINSFDGVGTSELAGLGFAVGVVVGGVLGLLVGLACSIALYFLLPTVLSGRQTPFIAAVEASAAAVILVFALLTLWANSPELLAPIVVLAMVAFVPCVWAANRALTALD